MVIEEFKKFIKRGNLLDMAIGFTVGASFTAVAKSLVNDIIMPPIGWVLGSADFSDLFFLVKEGKKAAAPYTTLASAQSAGAVTINYGLFLNNLLALILVAVAMFIIIRTINRLEGALDDSFGDAPAEGEPTEKKCEHCRMTIAIQATRCPYCTSHLEISQPSTK